MAQDKADRLLRPRTVSLAATIVHSAAPILPHDESITPSSPRRLRFLRILLLAGALYVSLMLIWSSDHLAVLSASDGSSASSSFRSTVSSVLREAKGMELMRKDFFFNTTGSLEDELGVQTANLVPPVRENKPTEQIETSLPTRTDPKQAIADAEEHARSVKMIPTDEPKQRRLKCVGWRATGSCSPHGPREPDNDKGCSSVIPNRLSGYCEVEDEETGERFRVMKRYCSSLRYDATFRCAEAPVFVNFQAESVEIADRALATGFALPNVGQSTSSPRDGIVMVVYPKLIASAYATVRALRSVLGCTLPIEIWFREQEMKDAPEVLSPLQQLSESNKTSSISFHKITDQWATGFGAKVFAIYHSYFDRVLFLDADNVPVRDPSFLFESPEFIDTGAVFWPDFWHPSHTIFNIHGQSLLWEILDTPFVNSFEQESGQLLIDRRRHAAPLDLVKFYTFHRPNPFTRLKLAYGDKDLFRFAWLKLKVPFHMVQTPPSVAGKVINGTFCGMTMVQHDSQGEVLFLHRNSNKLTGQVKRKKVYHRAKAIKRARNRLIEQGIFRFPDGKDIEEEEAKMNLTLAPTLEPLDPDGLPDPAMWSHLLSFNTTSRRVFYKIQPYRATPQFPDWQCCYGQRELGKNDHFYTQEFADLPYSGLETQIRQFAQDAIQIQAQT